MRLTGSKLDLGVWCLHWLEYDIPDRPGRPAVMGTAFHSLVSNGHHTEELSDAEEAHIQRRFDGWLLHGAPLVAGGVHEIAYQIRSDGTVVELNLPAHRAYPEGGICLTLDVQTHDRVIDLKTGKPNTPASVAWQLRAGAVCADVSRGEFHYVTEDGQVVVDATAWSDRQLAQDARTLVRLAEVVDSGERHPARPGEHCTRHYCPARKKCKAFKKEKQT